MIAGKHIVIGLSGGIACYKIATLVRLLKKAGAEVQVIMTPHAKEFITPLTLATLSGNQVISEFFTANTGEWHSHVSLGIWADAMIIAPATASTIGKMANGIADNMLITTYLSMKAPVWVAPSMDLDMMAHHSTIRNIEKLKEDGVKIIEPKEGELASHLIGKGRMEEPEAIYEVIKSHFEHASSLKGKKILVTSGPTYEKIDPVRYIGNYSSGKMGSAIADELALRGADVIAICGPSEIYPSNSHVEIIKIESAKEMLSECEKYFETCDVAILAAAVADYAPLLYNKSKIKRETAGEISLELISNPDIAATLGKCKKENQTLIGFALETDNEVSNALKKMKRKNLDFIILNSLKDPEAGFKKDTNKINIIFSNGNIMNFPAKTKIDVAKDIVDTLFPNN